jgi:hypothetical protein
MEQNDQGEYVWVAGARKPRPSDWACSMVIIYNRTLSKQEITQVEAWVDGIYSVRAGPAS